MSTLDDVLKQTTDAMREGLAGFVGEQESPAEQANKAIATLRPRLADKPWWPLVEKGIPLAFGQGSAAELEQELKNTPPAVLDAFISAYNGFPIPLVIYEWLSHKGYIRGWRLLREEDTETGKDLLLEVGTQAPMTRLSIQVLDRGESIDV